METIENQRHNNTSKMYRLTNTPLFFNSDISEHGWSGYSYTWSQQKLEHFYPNFRLIKNKIMKQFNLHFKMTSHM